MMNLIANTEVTSDTRSQISWADEACKRGFTIIRLAKTVKVKVTGHDIRWGKKEEAMSCPLARPLWNLGAKFVEVHANYAEMEFIEDERTYLAALDEEAQLFVKLFDHGEPVAPREFSLDLWEVKEF